VFFAAAGVRNGAAGLPVPWSVRVEWGAVVGRIAVLAAALAGAAGDAGAATVGEGMHRTLAAARTSHPPVIDGDLSDPAWAAAVPSDDFTQIYPIDGAAPTMATEVRVLYDDHALYIGVLCHDPEPDRIAARLARRDETIESDHVAITLDPRHDHDTGYWFWLNAAGVEADAQLYDDLRSSDSWDGVWRGAARIHAGGWSAELAIPWTILRFPHRPVHTWGFNVKRFVARTKETMQWVRVPPSVNAWLSRAGHLTGLAGLDPPRALELRPFAVASAHLDLGGDGASLRPAGSVGLDAKHAVGDDLTLDLTLLPDFGQVEADPAVLNLSTFETFFPEKRPFFLESSDLFVTDVKLFHSRRIGQRGSRLGEGDATTTGDGRPATVVEAPLAAPIWGAARLTGRLGPRLTIAALDALTGPETVDVEDAAGQGSSIRPTPVRDYAALRGKYSFGVSNYLGFLGTTMVRGGEVADPAGDHDAVAGSVDGRWVAADGTYRAFFDAAVTARIGGPAWVEEREAAAPCSAATCTPIDRADGGLQQPGDLGFGAMAGLAKAGGRHWVGWLIYNSRSPRFDANDVGFEPEWDLHRFNLDTSYREQQPFGPFQSGAVRGWATATAGWDGLLQDVAVGTGVSATTRGFWSHSLGVSWRPPHTFTRRETSDGARFERSDWASIEASTASDSRAWLRGSLTAGIGASPSDTTWGPWLSLAGAARPSSPLEVSLAVSAAMTEDQLRFHDCTASDGRACSQLSPRRDYRFADLDSGSLSLTARLSWALSTRLSLQGWAQLFAARGRWMRYREITGLAGARPWLARSALRPSTSPGDADGDGIKDDDFAWSSLSTNLVLRWEPSPGSALTLVYTLAQRVDRSLAGERPEIAFTGLAGAAGEHILLLKASWYFAR